MTPARTAHHPRPTPVSSTRRRQTPLNAVQLVEYTRVLAAEVRSGQYPFIDFDPETRWHRRIYRDPRVDVWLISWLPTQGTQLHDHGGSAGAFTVVSGRLSESVCTRTGPSSGRLSERQHEVDSSVGFGSRYVHDVRNTGEAPAVSVHTYSGPLTSMTYFDLDGDTLVRLETRATDDPEPDPSAAR